MSLKVEVRSVPKAGSTDKENEDRAGSQQHGNTLRLAIGDGATESSYSGLWAESLVRTWNEGTSRSVSGEFLRAARQAWANQIPEVESLPWYAQVKLEKGSHAALGCLTVSSRRRGFSWRGEFVGDCEMFLLKGEDAIWLRRRLPILRAADFGYSPDLVSTDPESWSGQVVKSFRGRVRQPFQLWLTTDGFAQSCLTALEAGLSPWLRWSTAMASAATFAAEVDRARQRGEMRNDDVTVLRLVPE